MLTHCSPQVLFAELRYRDEIELPKSEWLYGIRTVRSRMPDGQEIIGRWTKDFDDALQTHPAVIAAAKDAA